MGDVCLAFLFEQAFFDPKFEKERICVYNIRWRGYVFFNKHKRGLCSELIVVVKDFSAPRIIRGDTFNSRL